MSDSSTDNDISHCINYSGCILVKAAIVSLLHKKEKEQKMMMNMDNNE